MNRYIALQLLGWGEKGVIEKEFNSTEQYEIFKPLKELLELDGEFIVSFGKDEGINMRRMWSPSFI
ncbi:hypothetical protein [Clostridium tagluense]|uniref:Uncharacterized protein n=1 Tax=Clostridium tagluense TaxID=360422 RepID=A0A401UQ74_9CLOT|nr:hypothetical protein [Clostridium tagluense]GCD11670.1 hypothetical protein Ctaglu_32930 [Clostridium tagluense]